MSEDRRVGFKKWAGVRKHRILVIDTDRNIRRLIKRRFEQAGAEVYQAANSGDGMKAYLQHRPDMVIIDVTLPESEGWVACTKIREISLVPVLMLIGSEPDRDTQLGFEFGANEFVRKPFDPKKLLARTNSLLQQVGISRRSY